MRVLVGLLIHELDEATVLDNGHPGLGAQGVNHDLALHVSARIPSAP